MKTILAVAITLLFWSSAFAGIRAGLQGYSPGHVVLLRFLAASATFAVYALLTRMPLPRKEDWGKICILGFVGISFYHCALTFGEEVVPAGTASLLIATAPIFTALFAHFSLHEKLSPIGWGGLGLGFAGIAIVSLAGGGGVRFAGGALLILLSAVATSLFFVYQKPLLLRYKAIPLTAYFTWAGTLPLLVFSPGLWQEMSAAPPAATWATLYNGVFPAAVAYAAWGVALSRARASQVTAAMYLNPLLALFIAWIWLGEVPARSTYWGGTIALLGVILVNRYGKGRPAKQNLRSASL